MSAVPSPTYEETLRRGFPRHAISVPLDLIALQSGVPENLPGRCTDISEAGLGAIVAGELSPGQQVAIELRLPQVGVPLRVRALVRYQSRLHCGLELVGLSRDQRDMIRYWLYQSVPQPGNFELSRKEERKEARVGTAEEEAAVAPAKPVANLVAKPKHRVRLGRRESYVLCVCVLAVGGLGWWQWQRSWHELEAQAVVAGSALRVSAETMGTRIVTKVDPIYPEAARKTGTEGLVVLDAVIAPDGSVKKLRPVSGPDVLVQSAAAAVGAWKFEPYLSSGRPVEVETTVAIEFRLN